jgi:hypothetical protein
MRCPGSYLLLVYPTQRGNSAARWCLDPRTRERCLLAGMSGYGVMTVVKITRVEEVANTIDS